MADRETGTHIDNIIGYLRTSGATLPTDPEVGDEIWDTVNHGWYVWTGNNWLGVQFTSTSTSTSTTTSTSTSTSTTSTSTSSSTSTTTSSSTSTSTTI